MNATRMWILASASTLLACGPDTPGTDENGNDEASDSDTDETTLDETTLDPTETSETETSETETDTTGEPPPDLPPADPELAVAQLAAGWGHSCALLVSGELTCWGQNDYGQLGLGHVEPIGDDELPCGRVDIGGPALAVGAGRYHSCALREDGEVYCWGFGYQGQLGRGNIDNVGNDELPVEAGPVGLGEAAKMIAVGYQTGCAVTESDELLCWGYGWLGYGDPTLERVGDDELPSSLGAIDVGGVIEALALGNFNMCALLEGGAVRCWGSYSPGLGQDTGEVIGDDEAPASVPPIDLGGPAVAIAGGGEHFCALRDDGVVLCWGNNYYGQLGKFAWGEVGFDQSPASTGGVPLAEPSVGLGLGNTHSCAIGASGALYCWGDSAYGKRGQWGADPRTKSLALPSPIEGVDAGYEHTCAHAGGHGFCWGGGFVGQLGTGNLENLGDNEPPASAGPLQIECADCCATKALTANALDGVADLQLSIDLTNQPMPLADYAVGSALRVQGFDATAIECESCYPSYAIRDADDQRLLAFSALEWIHPGAGPLASIGATPETWLSPLELSAVEPGLCPIIDHDCMGMGTRDAVDIAHPDSPTARILDSSSGVAGGGYAIAVHSMESWESKCDEGSLYTSVDGLRLDCAPDCGPVTVVDACLPPEANGPFVSVYVLADAMPLEYVFDVECVVLEQIGAQQSWDFMLDCAGLPYYP